MAGMGAMAAVGVVVVVLCVSERHALRSGIKGRNKFFPKVSERSSIKAKKVWDELRGGSTMQNPGDIAQAFVNFYYQTFDTNRGNLASLYTESSMLTFEGTPFQGAMAIKDKLTSLPFQQVAHKVVTLDVQPLPGNPQGIIVLVCGDLVVDGDKKSLKFSQSFVLMPHPGSNNWYVQNDVFRLNYG
mmetsp:Transcript_14073/g.21342  ORF Transcript_14073/g.21342 Transcript_14073/m.21342 type:complete len:186 (+) Transcript_14073:3-560(+)